MVYLIHFAERYRYAGHYIGFVDSAGRDAARALESRLEYHRKGRGSRLLRAVTLAGIDFSVARTWPHGDRTFERKLKGHSATRLCPVCDVGALRRGLYVPGP